MDKKVRHQNMNSNRDANQEVYETLNMGIILEQRSLQTIEWPIGHQVYLIKVGVIKEVWTRGSQKCPNYKR